MLLVYDSAMTGQIEKSIRYAAEPERIAINGRTISFDSLHQEYLMIRIGDYYDCSCSFYQARGICRHTMTLERLEICPMRRSNNGCA